MLPVFALIALEKIVNLALTTDAIARMGLQSLSGKTMRLVMKEPAIEFDTIFNEDHIRFEPVTMSVFEPKGTDIVIKPDCTVTVDNPMHLINLMGEPNGNLPIEGDYKVLNQVKQLMAGFDPDIIGKLQPIIGLSLASQLTNLLGGLKANFEQPVKQVFRDLAQITTTQPADASEADALKQQLLKLRADIEREQARLEAIKQEQANLLQK